MAAFSFDNSSSAVYTTAYGTSDANWANAFVSTPQPIIKPQVVDPSKILRYTENEEIKNDLFIQLSEAKIQTRIFWIEDLPEKVLTLECPCCHNDAFFLRQLPVDGKIAVNNVFFRDEFKSVNPGDEIKCQQCGGYILEIKNEDLKVIHMVN